MIRKCYKQDEFVARIEGSLGVRMGDVSCKIVDTDGMAKAMGRAGWNRSDTIGVVGFQVAVRRAYDTLKEHGVLSLGLDDALMALSSERDAVIYLLRQRLA